MSSLNHPGIALVMLLMGGAIFAACDSAGSQDSTLGGRTPVGSGEALGADALAALLVQENATQRSGPPPSAADSRLRINWADTIFVVKDFRYGSRLVIRHDGRYEITGFYLGVPGASFHVDVPVVEAEAGDSTDVIYIVVNVPPGYEVDYPLSIPVQIQPHGPDGQPLDEFERDLVVEDPRIDRSNPACTITTPPTGQWWEWMFTVGIDYYGDFLHIEAPGLKQWSRYRTGGCCGENGESSTVANDPHCHQLAPTFRAIHVAHYHTWVFDMLWFFDDGRFRHVNASDQTNYIPSRSNFCTGEPAYDHVLNQYAKEGSYDFSPGADYLTVRYDTAGAQVFGKSIQNAQIDFTCNTFILTGGFEETWQLVFRRKSSADLPGVHSDEWWD